MNITGQFRFTSHFALIFE